MQSDIVDSFCFVNYYVCRPPLVACQGVVQMSEDAQDRTGENVTRLLKTLQGSNTYRSLQAMESLKEIGEPAVSPLIGLLTNEENTARWRSAMALARVGTYSVEPLIQVATHKDESIRNPAIWALAEIGSEKAVEPLIRIMQEEESECCRVLTAAALLKINDPVGNDAVQKEYERFGEEFRGMVDEAYSGS